MNPQEKTRDILNALDRRSTIAPRSRPTDSRIAAIDHLPWKTPFSIFNTRHIRAASQLIQILLAADTFDDFMDIVDEVRTFENDGLFLYTLYSSVRHRDDCIGVVLPPIEERAPHWFFAAETIHAAIQLSIHQPNADHLVINQTTADVSEPESRLAYFREDIGMNRHHWSWHVVYPSDWDEVRTGKIKDRKGELFYYMHQQMLARYDCDRLSNGLSRVVPLQNFHDELDAYFPHLTSQTTGVHFSSRPPGIRLRDLTEVSLQDMEAWRLRILDSIDQGYLRDIAGQKITLGNEKGIDLLGAVVEASSSSVNPGYYGNLHILGHDLISNVHDPDFRYRQQPGVMGFSESACRDPIFYRWHKYIDDIFNRHKITLTPYTRDELSFKGIRVVNAEVKAKQKNVMETFMRDSRSDLSQAPFLKTNGRILVRYQHLDHEPLTFSYSIENNTGKDKHVTIRVFLGPKYNENGNLMSPNEQRRLMIELDKIQKHLKPGMNNFTRADTHSSVTISSQMRSYRSLREGNVDPQVDYCSCGWPDHLFIPKGTLLGMDYNLFVMCTDFDEDKVDKQGKPVGCTGAISYCGSRDQKYPDKKPMGFPFDRRITARAMSDFLTENMLLTDVKIKFTSELKPVSEWTVQMYGNM